jgi:alkylhydroperoxidase/carboxymuconolactone decarboxylase family protein YurZ
LVIPRLEGLAGRFGPGNGEGWIDKEIAMDSSRPPEAYREFVARFPALGKAWDLIGEAGNAGPHDERMTRLLKLAIAIGAMREGAVRSGVRKAKAAGIPREEVEQLVPLAAGTIGMPAAVAVHSWIRSVYDRADTTSTSST